MKHILDLEETFGLSGMNSLLREVPEDFFLVLMADKGYLKFGLSGENSFKEYMRICGEEQGAWLEIVAKLTG